AAVNAGSGMTDSISRRLSLSLPGSAVLAAALGALVLITLRRAPRSASPFGVKLLSLSLLALIGLGGTAGAWAVHRQMRCLEHTGLTGLPCGVEAPSPDAGAGLTAEASVPAAAPAAKAETEETAPVRVGGAIREPRKLKNVSPVYPDIARQARVQGVVILECTIGRDGRIEHVRVLRGIPLLEAAAVDAVKEW